MPHAYFLGGNGGAKRRSCRPDGGMQRTTERAKRHNLPNPCRTPSVRPPTSDCRPQGGHPCIERTRDAHGRSNVLRPLQRRFKARKKPEGYTSTQAGLKRLKTQITAFRINENGKGTPSGVPQPIHKRKLVLVKEEFDASSSGGHEGSRTLDLCNANAALSQLSYAPVWLLLYHAGGGRARGKLKFIVPIPARRSAAGCGAKKLPSQGAAREVGGKITFAFS